MVENHDQASKVIVEVLDWIESGRKLGACQTSKIYDVLNYCLGEIIDDDGEVIDAK